MDGGRYGMEDDGLTVDLVDLNAHANAQLFFLKAKMGDTKCLLRLMLCAD
jgi:hypothetical protein